MFTLEISACDTKDGCKKRSKIRFQMDLIFFIMYDYTIKYLEGDTKITIKLEIQNTKKKKYEKTIECIEYYSSKKGINQ
jgi:hypothetical protein